MHIPIDIFHNKIPLLLRTALHGLLLL